jgi:serine phosphatase RsbU (regulator of sigma subunit)
LDPLDTLVLSTDGVIEATSERGEQFGFEGMERSLASGSSSPDELCDHLLASIRAHVGAAPQYDDLTLVLCGMGR